MKNFHIVLALALVLIPIETYSQEIMGKDKTLYLEGKREMKNGRYEHALLQFERVDINYSDVKALSDECRRRIAQSKFLQLPQIEFMVSGDVDTLRIEVSATREWSILDHPEWVHLVQEGLSNSQAIFTVDPNPWVFPREGEINFISSDNKTTRTCFIKQGNGASYARVSEKESFEKAAGNSIIPVNSNDDWFCECDDTWLSVSKVDSVSLCVRWEKNRSKNSRTASIHIKTPNGVDNVVYCTQEGGDTMISIDKSTLNYQYGKSSNNVIIKTNNAFKVNCAASWIHCSTKIIPTGDDVEKSYNLTITSDENTIAEPRSAIVYVETIDHISRKISVKQNQAIPTLKVKTTKINDDGTAGIYNISVVSNVPDWSVIDSKSSWCSAKRNSDKVQIRLSRNDWNSSRSTSVKVNAQNLTEEISVYQPNRGYKGRYNDHYDALGKWKTTYFSVGVHTNVGLTLSSMAFRWKPVEVSLINVNVNFLNGVSIDWEPMVRGFIPISRNGRWSGFLGLGPRIPMLKSSNPNHFPVCIELGTELNYGDFDKYGSKIFFRIDGSYSVGMTFDIFKWK